MITNEAIAMSLAWIGEIEYLNNDSARLVLVHGAEHQGPTDEEHSRPDQNAVEQAPQKRRPGAQRSRERQHCCAARGRAKAAQTSPASEALTSSPRKMS